MHKNALFLLKICKNRPALGAPPLDPFASGGWGLRLQTPAKFSPIEKFWLHHCI